MSQLPPDVDPRPELSRFYDNDDRLREYADATTLQHEQQRASGHGGRVRRALARVFPSLKRPPADGDDNRDGAGDS